MKHFLIALIVILAALLTYANWPSEPLPPMARITKIEVLKAKRALSVYAGSIKLREYQISLGGSPIGPKTTEGDKRTPEGSYTITELKRDSAFHRALRISYPTTSQAVAAQAKGQKPGGDVMIHGIRNGLGLIGRLHRLFDWTAGCIALTNTEVDQVFDATSIGTEVCIYP